jgi:seryl-tRNA synthetase
MDIIKEVDIIQVVEHITILGVGTIQEELDTIQEEVDTIQEELDTIQEELDTIQEEENTVLKEVDIILEEDINLDLVVVVDIILVEEVE